MSSLSFTQGFLLGQASVVIFIAFFIKFFIFGESPSVADTRAQKFRSLSTSDHHRAVSINSPTSSPQKGIRPASSSGAPQQARTTSNILRPLPKLTTATILEKTYYNVKSHQPESLDWFNVLIAQTIAQFRDDAHQDEAILKSLTSVLNGERKPDYLGQMTVTEISLGEDFPILSNCRVHPVAAEAGDGAGGRLQARMDVDLSDFITLGVETQMLLNYPKALTAILPVALAVSVVRFSGTLCVSFLPSAPTPDLVSAPSAGSPSSVARSPTSLSFSFLPDYRLDLSVRSLVGSRSRLQDIPKIAQLVESGLHSWIDERVVQPKVQQVVLPSLWPRKKNTREPSHSSTISQQIREAELEKGEHGATWFEREQMPDVNQDLEGHGGESAKMNGMRWRGSTAAKAAEQFEMPGGMPDLGIT